ncbi:unnamed protein product [Somion occarium]|uniref:BOD1/SHG1 domain-containing protein n=1 Tax=Somion occarium TaxID=3059160 RepID=A0ABP1D531_9APHY
MRISEPSQLVDEFKKSGEFDRLRRELLSQFRDGNSMASLVTQVEDIVKRQLVSDQKLQYMSDAVAYRELLQEVDRYPVVERAAGGVTTLADPAFISSIQEELSDLLLENRHPGTSKKSLAAASTSRHYVPSYQDNDHKHGAGHSHSYTSQVSDASPPNQQGQLPQATETNDDPPEDDNHGLSFDSEHTPMGKTLAISDTSPGRVGAAAEASAPAQTIVESPRDIPVHEDGPPIGST